LVTLKQIKTDRYQTWSRPYFHEMPYATHAPVLLGLLELIRPKIVIEFGGGDVSTKLFMKNGPLYGVDKIITLEDDNDWFEKIRQFKKGSIEFEPIHEPNNFIEFDLNKITAAELILIDSGITAKSRASLLKRILNHGCAAPIVVHDAEKRVYKSAMGKLDPVYFDKWRPCTAVIPNSFNRNCLTNLRDTIQRHELSPLNLAQWKTVFEKSKN
jgi:hypothetical protein